MLAHNDPRAARLAVRLLLVIGILRTHPGGKFECLQLTLTKSDQSQLFFYDSRNEFGKTELDFLEVHILTREQGSS